MSEKTATTTVTFKKRLFWFRRFGLAGFVFFLLKGLLWLLIPGLLSYLGFAD